MIGRLPPSPDRLVEAARLTGLAPADVRARLAGPLPRVLLTDPDPERARGLVAELEALQFAAFTCEPRSVPDDGERLLARRLELAFGRLRVVGGGASAGEHPARGEVGDHAGEDEELLPSALVLIQKGVRAATKTETTKTSERRLDLGRALLSGGLILTKKVDTTTTKTTSSRDAFVLLHRRDGGRDVMIYERKIDYRFLGADIQPSSAANFDRLIAKLRAWAPNVPFDDRVTRPGFVSGLTAWSTAPVDLALWLVELVHRRA